MKTLYGFYWNCKHYRSTNYDLLRLFADLFQMPVKIGVIGLTSEDVELERA